MNLGATLYVHGSSTAAAFYCGAFGMTKGYSVQNDDGTYLHCELMKNGVSIFAVSESSDEPARDAVLAAAQPVTSLGINLDSDDELTRAYEALSQGGHVLRPLGSLPWSPCSADVVDTYGVCWYIYISQRKP